MMHRRRADGSTTTSQKHSDSSYDPKLSHKSVMTKWMPFWIIGAVMIVTALSVTHFVPDKRKDVRRDEENRIRAKSYGKEKKGRGALAAAGSIDDSNVHYHIVFSTGCSLFQDWQSFVFFYQAMMTEQVGTITRIVSGCSDDDQVILQKIFDDQIVPMVPTRFKIHFTPDFSKVKPGENFKYFNKPFGMRHWLENKLGFPDKPIDEDSIVILLDPDQLILRPFANNNFTNTEWIRLPQGQQPRTRIEHGKPMGQLYGFGLQWKDKVDMKLVVPNEQSPIDLMSREEAMAGYVVGPPYVASARDMYKIVSKWCDFAVPVHDQYPYLLAEMFAYCLSAAHQRLAHQTAISFMVSDLYSAGEGWNYVDRLPDDELCHPRSIEDLPNVIHFCQRYGVGKYMFGKHRLPKDFLSCESPLLKEPTKDDLATDKVMFPDTKLEELQPHIAKRSRFMVCHLISIMNAAATYFKDNHCDKSKANYEKSLAFHANMTLPE